MVTPILMLLLMTTPCMAALALRKATSWKVNTRSAASIGLGVLFIFTGSGHFFQAEAMTQMLPPWVPGRMPLVYATGILEFAVAAGFFMPRYRRFTGIIAIALLILFFPANIYSAFNHIPMGEHAWGPEYLLVRGPLQAIIILWAYWFTVKRSEPIANPSNIRSALP